MNESMGQFLTQRFSPKFKCDKCQTLHDGSTHSALLIQTFKPLPVTLNISLGHRSVTKF